MTEEPDDQTLVEQVEYYSARAVEYDESFPRCEGRYDRGPDATAAWFRELEDVATAFDALPLDNSDVLELAPGTGIWTERLIARARAITAVDASPEMIEQNRARLHARHSKVEFVNADLFTWQPHRRFDGVVFCFWISHVPNDRLDAFLGMVASALKPGGWLFFLSNVREPTHTADDHVLSVSGQQVMVRRLDDGREFRIVKNYWQSEELERRCRQAGLHVDMRETSTYFQYGVGRRT
jgi:2-polyprenyl-3-methyl-5-hydroxy-6-metoxy-1,4-benzoquinol methylase